MIDNFPFLVQTVHDCATIAMKNIELGFFHCLRPLIFTVKQS